MGEDVLRRRGDPVDGPGRAYGTGDITPIATQVLQLGGIRFTGAHHTSREDGSLVAVSEAESARGHASSTVLNDATKVASVLPPP